MISWMDSKSKIQNEMNVLKFSDCVQDWKSKKNVAIITNSAFDLQTISGKEAGKHDLTPVLPCSTTGADRLLSFGRTCDQRAPVVKSCFSVFVLGHSWAAQLRRTTANLYFQPNGLQCTLRGLTLQRSSLQDVSALGRQTVGSNILVNP